MTGPDRPNDLEPLLRAVEDALPPPAAERREEARAAMHRAYEQHQAAPTGPSELLRASDRTPSRAGPARWWAAAAALVLVVAGLSVLAARQRDDAPAANPPTSTEEALLARSLDAVGIGDPVPSGRYRIHIGDEVVLAQLPSDLILLDRAPNEVRFEHSPTNGEVAVATAVVDRADVEVWIEETGPNTQLAPLRSDLGRAVVADVYDVPGCTEDCPVIVDAVGDAVANWSADDVVRVVVFDDGSLVVTSRSTGLERALLDLTADLAASLQVEP